MAAAVADTTKQEEEKRVIDTHQWQEILDATEVLALNYKEQKNQKHRQPNQKKKPSPVQISGYVNDVNLDEVRRAINKFKEHARSLGVHERELMEAVRDDDRSVPASSKKPDRNRRGSSGQQQKETKGGGVADRFIEMFDYFFVPPPSQSQQPVRGAKPAAVEAKTQSGGDGSTTTYYHRRR
jgi:hypothetical protein